jgi:long-chain acyl-CoA synthetase
VATGASDPPGAGDAAGASEAHGTPNVTVDDAAPQDAAAIIYTSGTTGHPKGVVLTHHNYHYDAWSLTEHLGCDATDRFLCFLPLYHVNAQVVSVLSAVHVGGALILLEAFSPTAFLSAVARYRATTFSAVPTVYAILNTLDDAERFDLSSLRYCVCGAAPMPVEVFTTFEKKYGAKIVEGYGLSEATCGNCVNPLRPGAERKIGSIGVPLPGQEMAILDDAGEPLGSDEVGEIAIRGPAVMREYFGNPDATREAIVDGWLRTGDLGRRDDDGYYFIVGRKKEMIIRGGQNIYPKEIEEVIYTHPAVQEAAVIGVAHPIWGESVCACVVPKPGASVDPDAIVALCRERLADYKVPARVVAFDAFPKTPTGKIQKNRIEVPPIEVPPA